SALPTNSRRRVLDAGGKAAPNSARKKGEREKGRCRLSGTEQHNLTRRSLMAGAGALLAAAAIDPRPARAHEPPKDDAPNAISPDAALERMMKGNERFAANDPNERDFSAGRAALAKAQFPIAAILSCSDSRVV